MGCGGWDVAFWVSVGRGVGNAMPFAGGNSVKTKSDDSQIIILTFESIDARNEMRGNVQFGGQRLTISLK